MSSSPKVVRQFDAKSGQHFLRGREEATADIANVFGDEDYRPLSIYGGELCFEVEVRYCFFEGTVDDWAEVHQFRAVVWGNSEAGPKARIIIEREDFNAYHEEEWGEWAGLLRVAVARIRDARHNKIAFEPCLIGDPPKPKSAKN